MSKVLEKGHTLILGWSDKITPLVNELAMANESEGKGLIVIMSRKGKVFMEESIASTCDLRNTRVVCRQGDETNTSKPSPNPNPNPNWR